MPHISPTTQRYLILLHAALYQSVPDYKLFEHMCSKDWAALWHLAWIQTTQALIADRILCMPEQCLPKIEKRVMLLGYIKQTQQNNLKLNSLLHRTITTYKSMGLTTTLLKGADCAQYYPNPLLRNPGDIDLIFHTDKEYTQASNWAKEQGYPYHEDRREGHWCYEVDSLKIEHHFRLTFFENKEFDAKMRNLWLKTFPHCILKSLAITQDLPLGAQVRVLPPTIGAFYIFMHLFFHFIHSGVGMRQICDWICYLQANQGDIDANELHALLRMYEMNLAMSCFAGMAVRYLQIPKSVFPIEVRTDDSHVPYILKEIISGGNFGFHHDMQVYGWKNRLNAYRALIKKSWRFYKLAPSYIHSLVRTNVTNDWHKIIQLFYKKH